MKILKFLYVFEVLFFSILHPWSLTSTVVKMVKKFRFKNEIIISTLTFLELEWKKRQIYSVKTSNGNKKFLISKKAISINFDPVMIYIYLVFLFIETVTRLSKPVIFCQSKPITRRNIIENWRTFASELVDNYTFQTCARFSHVATDCRFLLSQRFGLKEFIKFLPSVRFEKWYFYSLASDGKHYNFGVLLFHVWILRSVHSENYPNLSLNVLNTTVRLK